MTTLPFNLFAVVVMSAWAPLIIMMFALLRARTAVIAAFVIGYLFLPEVGFHFHTLPVIDKVVVTCVGVLLGSLIFDGGRLFTVRPRLLDIAWLILCICPFATSLSNGLGVMDGISSSLTVIFRWGIAYWVGRAYFTDWEAIRDLAVGIILGAIAYVPLCWWEIRMSPQLHGFFYGLVFESFRSDTYLFGVHLYGYRPNVFLANGLTVTMYMGTSAVLAYWAWMTQSPKQLMHVPMGWIALLLFITTIFCKAVGGIVLMTIGMAVLTFTRWPKTRVPALILMLVAPGYMAMRSGTDWSANLLIDGADILSHTRADSLKFRLDNEDLLAGKALQRPLLGWGGWARSHVYDLADNDLTIADGLWIITLGEMGFLGLGAFVVMVAGSAILLWKRIPTRFWTDPACAAAVGLAVILGMYMIDSLFNATFNSVASLAVGGVTTIGALAKRTFSIRAAQKMPATRGFEVLVRSVKDIPYVYSPHRS